MSLDNKTDAEMVAELMAIKKANGTLEEKPVWVDAGISLREKYLEPPFSILDTKTASWKKRKEEWLKLGIKSEEGRDVKVNANIKPKYGDPDRFEDKQTSIFDPALCELMYTWFCPKGGTILDPFAGGSVRAIIAHKLGYKYTGIELRPEQVESNIKQAKEILPPDNQPTWICGDSERVMENWNWDKNNFDMIFSCPPYANLEVYSEIEGDLSNMEYKDFLEKYQRIIHKSTSLLTESGNFAVFVVGDVRDEQGYYLDFISDTIKAFTDPLKTSTRLYNNMILLDQLGNAAIRASKFGDSKKVIKIHQNVLCFKKM